MNGTKKSSKLYRVSATNFKAINSVATGQGIVLDEVLRSLIKFAADVTARLVGMPAAVNYTVPNSSQCKDVGVVQKIFR
ncbi:MAG: hypothetical protein KME55_26620 [Nostoc indistinguendum CM1-VF10]|nr:hypothetical protein [Nostoc indistinguendum CM1-VF10]